MARARPDFTIPLAMMGVLLAIGIPSLRRGQLLAGWVCIGLAVAVAALTLSGQRRRDGR